MAWSIQFSKKARQQLDKFDPQVARRILQFLFERVAHAENPRSLGEALKGKEMGDLWRYRVGDYRILASIEDRELRILIVGIGNRREVYR
jgi:mRNA interferase RelE/StbE